MVSLDYLAGFFDGEGSVAIIRADKGGAHRSPTYVLRVSVAGTNPAPLKMFAEKFGGGIYAKRMYSDAHTPSFDWVIQARRAAEFLSAIAPLLVVKRNEAEVGMEFQRCIRSYARTYHLLPQTELTKREELRSRLVALHGKASRVAQEA